MQHKRESRWRSIWAGVVEGGSQAREEGRQGGEGGVNETTGSECHSVTC